MCLVIYSEVIACETLIRKILFIRLKKFASTPVLPYTSPVGYSHAFPHTEDSFHIPIVGYEVMEERARFTVKYVV